MCHCSVVLLAYLGTLTYLQLHHAVVYIPTVRKCSFVHSADLCMDEVRVRVRVSRVNGVRVRVRGRVMAVIDRYTM